MAIRAPDGANNMSQAVADKTNRWSNLFLIEIETKRHVNEIKTKLLNSQTFKCFIVIWYNSSHSNNHCCQILFESQVLKEYNEEKASLTLAFRCKDRKASNWALFSYKRFWNSWKLKQFVVAVLCYEVHLTEILSREIINTIPSGTQQWRLHFLSDWGMNRFWHQQCWFSI